MSLTSTSSSALSRSIFRRSVSTISNSPRPPKSAKSSQSQPPQLNSLDDDSYYPIGPSEPSSPDDAYISRYRNPSQHDDYILSDHHDPYAFRTRPTATQVLPPRKRPPTFDAAQSSFEARAARLEMERSWASSLTYSGNTRSREMLPDQRIDISKRGIGLCFPGSGSQYIGMGSFLLPHSKGFRDTWDEAEEALIGFERWRQSLDLVDRLHALGYTSDQANFLGGPMRRGATLGSNDPGLKHVVFNGPGHELTRSSNAQPAIFITSFAYLRALQVDYGVSIGKLIRAFSGHSSGEYTACAAAAVMTFTNAVHLTRLHGLLTSRTLELKGLAPSTAIHLSDNQRAQMSALLINAPLHGLCDITRVLSTSDTDVSRLGPVEIASINSSTQIVLSGSRAGVLAVCERLSELNIAHRAADLPCAGFSLSSICIVNCPSSAPFHCSFMTPASQGMAIALKAITLNPPLHPIILTPPAGQTSCTLTGDALRDHLAAAIRSPVMWSTTVAGMPKSNLGVDTLVFVGPGKALANLCRKEIPDGIKSVSSLATAHDFETLAQELAAYEEKRLI
ncbi:acyl transferase/acyl hydrolase/lysophospholipase [Melampsora americana]|nr:acyl transferase/acyl hydrolase/lysophospholipase [Melampsora americana]